jgi:hypothetical protein
MGRRLVFYLLIFLLKVIQQSLNLIALEQINFLHGLMLIFNLFKLNIAGTYV